MDLLNAYRAYLLSLWWTFFLGFASSTAALHFFNIWRRLPTFSKILQAGFLPGIWHTLFLVSLIINDRYAAERELGELISIGFVCYIALCLVPMYLIHKETFSFQTQRVHIEGKLKKIRVFGIEQPIRTIVLILLHGTSLFLGPFYPYVTLFTLITSYAVYYGFLNIPLENKSWIYRGEVIADEDSDFEEATEIVEKENE